MRANRGTIYLRSHVFALLGITIIFYIPAPQQKDRSFRAPELHEQEFHTASMFSWHQMVSLVP